MNFTSQINNDCSSLSNFGLCYVLYLEPFLDKITGKYSNILTINDIPPGPLSNIIYRISRPKLSDFSQYNSFSQDTSFMFVLSRSPKNICNNISYLYSSDIPFIISYLENNGYVLNFSTSKILHFSNINCSGDSNKKFICSFSYSG